MFNSRVNRVTNLKIKGDLTTFTWEVGRFGNDGFGDPVVMSQLVQGGSDEWKLTLFPKVHLLQSIVLKHIFRYVTSCMRGGSQCISP